MTDQVSTVTIKDGKVHSWPKDSVYYLYERLAEVIEQADGGKDVFFIVKHSQNGTFTVESKGGDQFGWGILNENLIQLTTITNISVFRRYHNGHPLGFWTMCDPDNHLMEVTEWQNNVYDSMIIRKVRINKEGLLVR